MPGDNPFAGLPERLHGFAGNRDLDGLEYLHTEDAAIARIEQKLDALIKALKSGAIGAWGTQVSWRGQCHWEGCESRQITWTPPDGKNLCQIHSELLRETPGPHPIR